MSNEDAENVMRAQASQSEMDISDQQDDTLVFNSINADEGGDLLPPMSMHDVAQIVQGKQLSNEQIEIWRGENPDVRLLS